MAHWALLTFISKSCLGDSAFVLFVPRKCFNEGLIEKGSVKSQKFKFVNMGLVCISRKDLYGVVEAKQCLNPPPIFSKRLICGLVGFSFLFFLDMPAYPIISKLSFCDVITSLLYSIELAFQYLGGMSQKWRFRNLYPLSTCRLYLPFLNKTVTRIRPPFGVFFSLAPGYFPSTRLSHSLPVYPPSLHSAPLLVKISYVMLMIFKTKCLALNQVV